MKKSLLFHKWIFLILLIPSVCFARAPRHLGGFVLGGNIADYADKLKMETALPIRYMEYIKEVEVKKIQGFKTGLISYGTCALPGKILRIKFKYENSSKRFFNQLLDRFKADFKAPVEWRGDPFHVVIAWKWSFVTADKDRISMILQHNTMDDEEKKGNAVKMTLTDLLQKEGACFATKYPDFRKGPGVPRGKPKDIGQLNWDLLVPR